MMAMLSPGVGKSRLSEGEKQSRLHEAARQYMEGHISLEEFHHRRQKFAVDYQSGALEACSVGRWIAKKLDFLNDRKTSHPLATH